MPYIQRTLEATVLKAVKEFPVLTLTGPRQSGKTTLLKHLFSQYRYLSLESPDIQLAAKTDPRAFLALYPPPVIFDEVQYIPELFPYIKEYVDAHRKKKGQFLLTGSQNLLLSKNLSESLAGRTVILKLLPLTLREKAGLPSAGLPWQKFYQHQNYDVSQHRLWESLLRGHYPELIAEPHRDAGLWYSSYLQTYLERDVRLLHQVGDLTQFQLFLRMLASRSAQLLDLSSMARDLGIAVNTVKKWISVLEATYQIIILRPYFANVGKRLVKTPKVYFLDVGMLCALVGLKEAEHARLSPMSGAIIETAVVTEIYRTLVHQGIEPALYFWRTSNQEEVDLLVEEGDKLVPLEIKASATPSPTMTKSLSDFMALMKKKVDNGFLIHTGLEKLPLGKRIIALPFSEL